MSWVASPSAPGPPTGVAVSLWVWGSTFRVFRGIWPESAGPRSRTSGPAASGLRPASLGLRPDPAPHRLGATVAQSLVIARHLADACGGDPGDGLGTGQLLALERRQFEGFAAPQNVAATDMAAHTMRREELLAPLRSRAQRNRWLDGRRLRSQGRPWPGERQQQQGRNQQAGEQVQETRHRPDAGSAPILAAPPQNGAPPLMPEPVIRRLTPTDEPQLIAVYRDAVLSQAVGLYEAAQIDAWAHHAERHPDVSTALRRGYGLASCDAADAGVIEAFALLDPIDRLSLLYCRGRSCRQGRGRRLVQALEAEARRQHCRRLRTEASQLSRPLLQTMGWRIEAEEELLFAGQPFRRWRMIKDLP